MLLRRLVIGLLILSALTAEGMAFFNTALVPLQNYMFSLTIDDDKDECLARALDEKANIIPVQYKPTAFVPMAEILQAKEGNKGAFCYAGCSFMSSLEPFLSYSPASVQAAGAKAINISLNGSDLSPPSL